MSNYSQSREKRRKLRHGSISQFERHYYGVQGGEGPITGRPMPGFNPDAEWGTEEWFEEKRAYYQRRREAQEAHDEDE